MILVNYYSSCSSLIGADLVGMMDGLLCSSCIKRVGEHKNLTSYHSAFIFYSALTTPIITLPPHRSILASGHHHDRREYSRVFKNRRGREHK